MEFKNTEVWGFEHALRGMRNPLESWSKSDSLYCALDEDIDCHTCGLGNIGCNLSFTSRGGYIIGNNDLLLAQKLIKAGSDHSKFLRQIMVSVDITAPTYWWKETDQYRVGVTTNSTSTIHKLSETSITRNCFEFDETDDYFIDIQNIFIEHLEKLRLDYLETKDIQYWRALVQLLPSAWLYRKTTTLNYAVLRNMFFARCNHKLDEWSVIFVKWIESLPYSKELICYE